MGRLALAIAVWTTLGVDVDPAVNPSTPTRRPVAREESDRWGWLSDPRSAVLLTLATIIGIGGGRRLMKSLRSRRLLARLAEPDVTLDEIHEVATHGREGLIDLFRILGTATDSSTRDAAGRAIAALWKQDNLIAEEERALVRRGFVAEWRARRRYPREIDVPIPIRVQYGVPFLRNEPGQVGPNDLAWSHRILGAERLSLEEFTAWTTGVSLATFAIDPSDFPSNGPHRLILQARVRTKGLTEFWELELPHIPFSFEFDPILRVDALLTLPDETREGKVNGAIRLVPSTPDGDRPSRYVPIGPDLLLRDPPSLVVQTPLPCDLSHSVEIEIEGIPGRVPAGQLIISGQGIGGKTTEIVTPIALSEHLPAGLIERPGEVQLRVVLIPDPARGWADPEIRSIWPGTITTGWAPARVVRR